jgi:hypothetical protein
MTRLISSLAVLAFALPIIDGHRMAARAADPPVTVTNTPTNPVPVQEVDNFAKHPFQVGASGVTNAFNPSGFTMTVVPAGKRLVVEFISASCNPTGMGGVVPGPLAILAAGFIGHFIALTPGTGAGHAGVSQMMRLYAEPGTNVNLTLYPTTNAATVTCNAAISGYLATP